MFWIPCAPEALMNNPRMRDELWHYLLDLQRMPENLRGDQLVGPMRPNYPWAAANTNHGNKGQDHEQK